MRNVLDLVSLMLAGTIGAAASAQINYLDQFRAIEAFSQTTPSDKCDQGAAALNFDVFDESVECPGANAQQNSSFGPTMISITGAAASTFQDSSSSSRLTSHFTVTGPMRYELHGQLFHTAAGVEVRMVGPSGAMHHPIGTMAFRHCGMLAPATYEILSKVNAPSGTFGNVSCTLRIARLGDIDGDQAVGLNDLQSVLNAWGACAANQACPSDLDCDNSVNVSDLLGVINNWG